MGASLDVRALRVSVAVRGHKLRETTLQLQVAQVPPSVVGSSPRCGTLLLDSDITPEHRLLLCVRPSLSNLEHYSGRNVGAVMFQVRQQKSRKGLVAQAVFRKKTSGNRRLGARALVLFTIFGWGQ